MAIWVQTVRMLHHAKFRGDRPNRYIPRWRFIIFWTWRPSDIFDLLCAFGPPTKSILWFLLLCKIWLESIIRMHFHFASWFENACSRCQNGVLGALIYKCEAYQHISKVTSLDGKTP